MSLDLLAGWRNEGFRERLVFAQPIRKGDAVDFTLSGGVACPQAGGGYTADVAAYDDLNRQRRDFMSQRHVRVGDGNYMILYDISCLLKPPGRKLIEHLPFVGNLAEDAIKGTQAVRRDQQAAFMR